MVMKQRLLIPALLAVLGFCAPDATAQQNPATAGQSSQPPQMTLRIAQDADFVRDQLWEILRGYPRTVGEILRRDPSLMARPEYMNAYPQLAAFIAEHPEVPR